MSKILKAVDITTAFAEAKDEKALKNLFAQVIKSVEAQEAENALNIENYNIAQSAIAVLSEKVDVEAKAYTALELELQEANETISDLGSRLSIIENNPDAGLIVTVGGLNYEIIGKQFITLKGVLTDKELSKDIELLRSFIEKGSAALKLLTHIKPSNLN